MSLLFLLSNNQALAGETVPEREELVPTAVPVALWPGQVEDEQAGLLLGVLASPPGGCLVLIQA